MDCDDRTLPVISRLRKDTDQRHNLPDMDHRTTHRNLISLTGSPKIDTDYRGVSRSNSIGEINLLLRIILCQNHNKDTDHHYELCSLRLYTCAEMETDSIWSLL